MVAIVAAMMVAGARYRQSPPLLWFSGVMVVVIGGLTIWLHDETFIKLKPTHLLHLRRRTPRLWPGDRAAAAEARAWQRLSRARRGGLAQADPQLGDLLRVHGRRSTKRCGATARPISGSASNCGARSPLTLLFAVANVPMLLRHGLMREEAVAGRAGAGRMSDADPVHPQPQEGLWHRRRGAEIGRPRHQRGRDFRAARPQWRRQNDADLHRLRDRHADRRRSPGRRPGLAARLPRTRAAGSAWFRRSLPPTPSRPSGTRSASRAGCSASRATTTRSRTCSSACRCGTSARRT